MVKTSFEDRLANKMKQMGWKFNHSKDLKKEDNSNTTINSEPKKMNINEFLNEQ